MVQVLQTENLNSFSNSLAQKAMKKLGMLHGLDINIYEVPPTCLGAR